MKNTHRSDFKNSILASKLLELTKRGISEGSTSFLQNPTFNKKFDKNLIINPWMKSSFAELFLALLRVSTFLDKSKQIGKKKFSFFRMFFVWIFICVSFCGNTVITQKKCGNKNEPTAVTDLSLSLAWE